MIVNIILFGLFWEVDYFGKFSHIVWIIPEWLMTAWITAEFTSSCLWSAALLILISLQMSGMTWCRNALVWKCWRSNDRKTRSQRTRFLQRKCLILLKSSTWTKRDVIIFAIWYQREQWSLLFNSEMERNLQRCETSNYYRPIMWVWKVNLDETKIVSKCKIVILYAHLVPLVNDTNFIMHAWMPKSCWTIITHLISF